MKRATKAAGVRTQSTVGVRHERLEGPAGRLARGTAFFFRGCKLTMVARAGIAAAAEQRLPDSVDRLADLLLSTWRGRTVAVDFTIITRPSSSLSSTSTTTLMDQTGVHKDRKSRQACEAAGWAFQPFVADTYGAMRADARGFTSRFIKQRKPQICSP